MLPLRMHVRTYFVSKYRGSYYQSRYYMFDAHEMETLWPNAIGFTHRPRMIQTSELYPSKDLSKKTYNNMRVNVREAYCIRMLQRDNAQRSYRVAIKSSIEILYSFPSLLYNYLPVRMMI